VQSTSPSTPPRSGGLRATPKPELYADPPQALCSFTFPTPQRLARRTGGLRGGAGDGAGEGGLEVSERATAQAEQAKAAGRIRDGRSSAPRPFSGFARIHPGEPTQAAAESKEGFEAPAARSSASSKLIGWFFFLRVASASSKAQDG